MKKFLVLALIVVAATTTAAEPFTAFRSAWEPQHPSSPEHQPTPQPQEHPVPHQKLNPCRDALLQQCSPVADMSFLRSQVVQHSSCLVMWEQCCQQLKAIPKQSRCEAIHNVVHAIVLQQQQQLVQGISTQPQQQQQQGQQQQGQGSSQPQQQTQLDQGWIAVIGTWVIQTIPAMCDVHVPPYCYTTISPSIDVTTGMGGY